MTAITNTSHELDRRIVSEAMHSPVRTCAADTPLPEVARDMVSHGIHAIVVEDARAGAARWSVLSALDLAEAVSASVATTAGEAAMTEAVTVPAGESLRRAAQLMAEHGASHLLVRDEAAERPAGIISTTDIARAFAQSARAIAPLAHGPIVVGVDGSDLGEDAVALARLLAPALGGRLVLAHAIAALAGRGGATYDPVMRTAAREVLAGVAPDLDPAHADSRLVECLSRAGGLTEVACDTGAAAIVLGSTHRGPVGRVLAGSLADDILRQARCPVVVAPRGYRSEPHRIRTIGVGYDNTPDSDRALDFAVGIATATGAVLRLWCVVAPTGAQGRHPERSETFTRYIHEVARRELSAGVARIPTELHCSTAVLEGSPAEEIAAAAKRDAADLIVVGTGAHGALARALLGSTSRRLVRTAPAPVAVVPLRRS